MLVTLKVLIELKYRDNILLDSIIQSLKDQLFLEYPDEIREIAVTIEETK